MLRDGRAGEETNSQAAHLPRKAPKDTLPMPVANTEQQNKCSTNRECSAEVRGGGRRQQKHRTQLWTAAKRSVSSKSTQSRSSQEDRDCLKNSVCSTTSGQTDRKQHYSSTVPEVYTSLHQQAEMIGLLIQTFVPSGFLNREDLLLFLNMISFMYFLFCVWNLENSPVWHFSNIFS